MSKTSFKKLTCLVLAVLMLLSVMAVSASAADISTASTGAGKTVYFDPGKAADGNPVWFAWTWGGGVSDSWSNGTQSGDYIVFNNIGGATIVTLPLPQAPTAAEMILPIRQPRPQAAATPRATTISAVISTARITALSQIIRPSAIIIL